jgi:hypothetical protein
MVGFDLGDREQRQAEVAQRAEQSVQCRLVDDGAFDEGGFRDDRKIGGDVVSRTSPRVVSGVVISWP